ncbi:DUF4062 domain-containing protein [Lactococcus petauri]|uniref:DUF4062 domain-containing protein n=1 Tax=Lactococcus petauri TaxID=1940789 RepID=UPI0013FDD63F|nr:DUF4062 domain-containing protein [Lactococcus petauri]NHI75206.1 DUF4062 domain-containing protein [Lactococcus petauri]
MQNLEKKYQVFISSTYTDLIEERQIVVEGILNAGHIPAGMELFHAGDETQKELISEWIEDSDIYVLILGGRYGSLDDDGMGYTHWEYEKAKELGKPIFSLVLTEDYLNNKVTAGKIKATDLTYHDDKLVNFRNEVMSKIVSNIDNIAQIEAEVIKSINRIIKKRGNDLEGWIKGSSLKELEALRKENKKLSSELVSRQGEVIVMQEKLNEVKDDFIGSFRFSAVKEILSNDFPVKKASNKIKKVKEKIQKQIEQPSQTPVYNRPNYENDMEFVENIENLKLSSLDMLLRTKSQLTVTGWKETNMHGDNLFLELYLSRWMELSLVELKKGTNKKIDVYVLSANGKKFVSMIEIENLKSE